MSRVTAYLERFGFCARQIPVPPHAELALAVVIPCSAEPDLVTTLESLWSCARPPCAVEVIVVLNSAQRCSPHVRGLNARTRQEVEAWIFTHSDPTFRFHLLDFPDLPPKQAGVGLARKIGMDEAAVRLVESAPSSASVLACLDADCSCDSNYLTSLFGHFRNHPDTPGCSVYFEHPLDGPLARPVYEAITGYELHLRYYVQALRFAGFPSAYHTVGSAMAVRPEVYLAQGGMNRRQAGEDFYFLQKIIPLGDFTELNETRVLPSPRPSERVPFGTGRAVRNALVGAPCLTYAFETFIELGVLFQMVNQLEENPAGLDTTLQARLAPWLQAFLTGQNWSQALREIGQNTASPEAFRKRFFRWFDGFRVLKGLHYARDHAYGSRPILGEALSLWNAAQGRKLTPPPEGGTRTLLELFRRWDRRGWRPRV